MSDTQVHNARGTLTGKRFEPAPYPSFLALTRQPMPPTARSPSATRAAGRVAKAGALERLILKALDKKLAESNVIRLGDAAFYLPTLGEARQVLEKSHLDRRTWLAERFDCDDFSHVLKGEFAGHAYDDGNLRHGFAAGIIWGRFSWVDEFHAVNLLVTADQKVRLIEPQDDKVYGAEECQGEVTMVVV